MNVPAVFAGPLDGVIGADTLSSFDVDLDLPHYRMILYQRQACPDAKPAWAEPYTRITAGRSKGDHLFFPVQLDGRMIDAFVDTGAQLTMLSTRIAQALGVSVAALARDRPMTTSGAAAEQQGASKDSQPHLSPPSPPQPSETTDIHRSRRSAVRRGWSPFANKCHGHDFSFGTFRQP